MRNQNIKTRTDKNNGHRPAERCEFGAESVANESHGRARVDGRGEHGQRRHVLFGHS